MKRPFTPSALHFTLESAEGAIPLIPPSERNDVERVLLLCRNYYLQEGIDANVQLQELGTLIEVLARRSAQAMPFAALGRMLYASIKGDDDQAQSLMEEFHVKLSQLGL